MDEFIVAEISKSYQQLMSPDPELISQKFEKVINFNYRRGYDLIEWKLNTVVHGNIHNETIVAVFRKNSLREPNPDGSLS